MRAFTVDTSEQRSAAWFEARLGRATGSRAGDILATIKSGEAAARRDYRTQLVCERLTGQPQDSDYINADMLRGIECEPLARAAYEALTGELVTPTGFLAHTELMAGCSLDSHVGDFDGIIEIKVPRSANHLKYLKSGKVPAEHMAQITHNLFITGAAWCDFVSWDDRFPPELQLFTAHVSRSEVDIAAYELLVRQFLREVDDEEAAVRALCQKAVTA